jgi:heptaprenyl diphosphate synthase
MVFDAFRPRDCGLSDRYNLWLMVTPIAANLFLYRPDGCPASILNKGGALRGRLRSMTHTPDADTPSHSAPTPSVANMLAILAATAMFFSTLEYLIPKPVPFFRIGLANIPILVTMRFLRPRHVLALTLLKVAGQGLINGTLASYVFLFSLFGSLASTMVMLAVLYLGGRRISLIGVSTAGAIASNVVQVTLSVLFIFGPRSWVIAPPFLLIGTLAGVLVGALAERISAVSLWLRRLREDYRRLLSESPR